MMIKLIRNVVLVTLVSLTGYDLSGSKVIPFEMLNGLMVVQAETNGVGGHYIVDSGANGVLMNAKPTSNNKSYTSLDGEIKGEERLIKSLKIGVIEHSDIPSFFTDLSSLEVYIDRELSGILGYDIFSPHSVKIDFNSNSIILSDEEVNNYIKNTYQMMRYELINDLPVVSIDHDGDSYLFIVDTGASSHFIDKSLIESGAISSHPTALKKAILTAGGTQEESEEFLISIKVGSEIKAFAKDFTTLSIEMGKPIAGLLSLTKLNSEVIYFDMYSKTIYF